MQCSVVFLFCRTVLVLGCCLFLGHASWGQQTLDLKGELNGKDLIVAGLLQDQPDGTPIFQAIWRGVPGGNAVFQWTPTADPPTGLRLMLDHLLEAGLGTYLDARLRFTRDGVAVDQPATVLIKEMDAMVHAAAEDFGVTDAFVGFSPSTREQLDRLTRIDWSQARFGIDGGAEQDKYLAIFFYVRSQREELERQIRADLLPLSGVVVIGPKKAHPGTTVQVNSTCGTVFDEQNFLCALDLQLADTGSGGVDPELGLNIMRAITERTELSETPVVEQVRIRKRDRWLKNELDNINTRIDQLDQRKELWALRDRIEDIEDRLTDLNLEVQEVREERGISSGKLPGDTSDHIGRNVTIRFARNAITLDAEYRVLLNEVFEQLARLQNERVLITGFTDRSGDPALNLRLSEQRAEAVRKYLLQRGIAPERLLVNYYGDSRSFGRDPNERRVEVEWLK
jgi:outer membrane protein OmpA-like peptidoglycan-associated protein